MYAQIYKHVYWAHVSSMYQAIKAISTATRSEAVLPQTSGRGIGKFCNLTGENTNVFADVTHIFLPFFW